MQWRPVPRADISIPNVGELSIQDGVKRRRLIYLGRHNNPATARGCGRGGESALSRDRGLLEPSEPSALPIPILFPRSHNTTRGERDQVHFVRSTSWQFCSDQEGCSVLVYVWRTGSPGYGEPGDRWAAVGRKCKQARVVNTRETLTVEDRHQAVSHLAT